VRLTERQREILVLVAQGQTNKEIAQRLWLGENTVKTHQARIKAELGARDCAHAVIIALKHRLIRLSEIENMKEVIQCQDGQPK